MSNINEEYIVYKMYNIKGGIDYEYGNKLQSICTYIT